MEEKIVLTPREYEDLKEEMKFKEMVAISLKQLRGLPQKVSVLETHRTTQWFFIAGIILGIFGIWYKLS